jgi:hypothetical protein
VPRACPRGEKPNRDTPDERGRGRRNRFGSLATRANRPLGLAQDHVVEAQRDREPAPVRPGSAPDHGADGTVVPDISPTVIRFTDDRYSPAAVPIRNLPGYFTKKARDVAGSTD